MTPTPDELGPVNSDTMQFGGQQNTQTEDRTAERGGEGPDLPPGLAWAAAVGAGSALGSSTGPLNYLAAALAVQSLGQEENVTDVPEDPQERR